MIDYNPSIKNHIIFLLNHTHKRKMPGTPINRENSGHKVLESPIDNQNVLNSNKIELVVRPQSNRANKQIATTPASGVKGANSNSNKSPVSSSMKPVSPSKPKKKTGPIFKNFTLFVLWSMTYLTSVAYISFAGISAIIYYPSLKNTEFEWTDEEGPFYLSLL